MKSSLIIPILFIALAFGAITTGTEVESPRIIRESASVRAAYAVRYRLDADQSRFMIDANSAGLLWFLGHNHHIAARDFTGEVEVTPDTLAPASLQMVIKTESLSETGERFTDEQKKIINGAMHKEVLETAKYPEAVFKSTNVTLKKKTDNQFEVRIEGQLTLHGVTRNVVIPAQVVIDGDTLRASGKFQIDRDDFNIKTHSIKWGTIKVDDDMKLSFNIVARRS